MTQVTINALPFVIVLWYFLLSAPLTYFTLKFIAAFVIKHRERLEHGLHPKHGARGVLDRVSAAHSIVSPRVLLVSGWMLFPVCAFLTWAILGWYYRQVTNPFHEGESEAGS
jgi:hypothetical protein